MTVQISPGLRLDDNNARKFAYRMLEELEVYDRAVERAFGAMLRNRTARMGNPISQGRELNRIMRAMGPTLLTAGLRHGHNKKFFAMIHRFVANATDTDSPKFLGIQYLAIGCEGRHQPFKSAVNGVIDFSLHALQRMIQRAGIAMADDYQPFLRSIAMPGLALALSIDEAGNKGHAVRSIVWPLPVVMPNGERILLLTVKEGDYPPMVKTVYKGVWRQQPELLALEQALAPLTPQNPPSDKELKVLMPLFLAASRHFKVLS